MTAPESSSKDTKDRDSRMGTVLADRYRVDRLLDRGAMGRVYVGEHVLMRKRVAIKILHRELTVVPEFVKRFEREAMAAANIENEHVVAATDFGKLGDGAVFLVLEYVEGKNLRHEIANGPMSSERALRIGRQIAYALKSAHALGIVHRDLKPENVMLIDKAGDPDFVKVLDFGIAKVPIGERKSSAPPGLRGVTTKAGMVFGTPEYMPPEQALGQKVDARADLYSLGILLFEMHVGVRPFQSGSEMGVLGQQLAGAAPRMSSRNPQIGVHPRVEAFIARLLEREPSGRPQTAQEVLNEIDQLLGVAPRSEKLLTLKEGTLPPPPNFSPPPVIASDPPVIPMQGPLDQVLERIEQLRGHLPKGLRNVQAPLLIAVPVAIIGLVLGVGIVAAVSPSRTNSEQASSAASSASASAEPKLVAAEPVEIDTPPRASEEEITGAQAAGVTALSKLARKYDRDPKVPIAISAAYLKERDFNAAVHSIARALELDPELRRDKQVSSVLWVASQNRKSMDAAFDLLEGPMGDRGEEILRDLVTTNGVRPDVKKRAQASLAH